MKIGFIGMGNMATAMVKGILKGGKVKPEEIIASNRSMEKLAKAKENFGIAVTESNVKAAEQSEIIVLSVKPQFYETVISEIKEKITKEKIVVSIAPGKTLDILNDWFGKDIKLVRCMPNTPALVGEGCTGVCCNRFVTKEETTYLLELFSGFGLASLVAESLMDAVIGVSGSSPAYVFLFIEAMADGAVAAGMPRKQAYQFAAQAVLGSAKMVLETGMHPGELKDMVCSPGGTTIQAVRVLEEKRFRSAVLEAMAACIEKSGQM